MKKELLSLLAAALLIACGGARSNSSSQDVSTLPTHAASVVIVTPTPEDRVLTLNIGLIIRESDFRRMARDPVTQGMLCWQEKLGDPDFSAWFATTMRQMFWSDYWRQDVAKYNGTLTDLGEAIPLYPPDKLGEPFPIKFVDPKDDPIALEILSEECSPGTPTPEPKPLGMSSHSLDTGLI
jgi:hypothetical protein